MSFTLLVWLIDGLTGNPDGGVFSRLRSAFILGWVFGFGYSSPRSGGSAMRFSSMRRIRLGAAFCRSRLPAYLALFYGFATMLARMLWSDGFGRLAALAFGFGIAEWLRSFLLTGFPWNAIGYGIMPIPLMMQSAAVIGVSGVTVIAVFIFSAPALIGTKRGMGIGLALAALLFAAHIGFGAWRLSGADAAVAAAKPGAATVRLVQPMIDQSRKLDDRERASIFEEHLALSALPPQDGEKQPDIIVWPETSIPFILTDNPDALSRISEVLKPGQVLMTGAVRAEDAGPGLAPRYYNSIYVVDHHARSSAPPTRCISCPMANTCPMRTY